MIEIKKSPGADSRSRKNLTKEELKSNTKLHIEDVKKGISFFIDLLKKSQEKHDYTKLEYLDEFYKDFKKNFSGEENRKWLYKHYKTERHHFKIPEYIQDDIDLIDILEQVADSVMAGKARTGEFYIEIPPLELLRKAYVNTANKLLSEVKVIDNE